MPWKQTLNCPCCSGACSCCKTIVVTLSCFTSTEAGCDNGAEPCGHRFWMRSTCCDEPPVDGSWAHYAPPSDTGITFALTTDPSDDTKWKLYTTFGGPVVFTAPKEGRCPDEIPKEDWTLDEGECEMLEDISCVSPEYIPFWLCGESGDPAYVYTVNPACCRDEEIFPSPPSFLQLDDLCYYAGASVIRDCPWDITELPCKYHPIKCPEGYVEASDCTCTEECACPGDTGISTFGATVPSAVFMTLGAEEFPGDWTYSSGVSGSTQWCGYGNIGNKVLGGKYMPHARVFWTDNLKAYADSLTELDALDFADWPETCGFVCYFGLYLVDPEFTEVVAAGYVEGAGDFPGTYPITKKEHPDMPSSVTVFP